MLVGFQVISDMCNNHIINLWQSYIAVQSVQSLLDTFVKAPQLSNIFFHIYINLIITYYSDLIKVSFILWSIHCTILPGYMMNYVYSTNHEWGYLEPKLLLLNFILSLGTLFKKRIRIWQIPWTKQKSLIRMAMTSCIF